MKFENVFIPYGGYWSSPFSKWQGSLGHLHSMVFAADMAKNFLTGKNIAPDIFDGVTFGITIPQKSSFYGTPWLAGMIGAVDITGPTISQACATSVKVMVSSALEIETGLHNNIIAITADKTSNSPHIYYPNPMGIGGIGDKEDWVLDNFGRDPFARNAMIQTAENVAKAENISKTEQDDMALLRYEQYSEATKDNHAFQKKYMILPLEVKDARGKKVIKTLEGDEGIFPTTKEGLAKLPPVMKDGSVSFGSQTFPADGNCGIIITTRENAQNISNDKGIKIQLISFGEARVPAGFMPKAVVPAAEKALSEAGKTIDDITAIKTHNPFAINDVYFTRKFNVKPEAMNNYGSPLIYGHPQAPTGTRAILELIEELVIKGGGYGLFSGCAAGDTAAAIVLKVN